MAHGRPAHYDAFLEKWLKYEPMGTTIKDTRIIPTKTPLKTNYHKSITSDKEFTPTQMVESVKGMGLRLVKVIDLTRTDRYYSPQELKQHSVEYCKIRCEGYASPIPPPEVYERFHEKLKSALTEFSGAKDVVVVHSTSGFNRAGYMVCRYLMTEHKYNKKDALEAFKASRGYSIDKKEYLEHLELLERLERLDKPRRPPKADQPHNQPEPRMPQNRYELLKDVRL